MTPTDVAHLYRLLREGLQLYGRADEAEVGFPNAIEEEIAAGKQVRVQLAVMSEQRIDDPLAGSRTTARRSRAQFVQQQEFEPAERVAITLDGIALARIAPVQMADKIFSLIRELAPDTKGALCFAHDQAEAHVRKITAEDVVEALPATERLAIALKRIRAELGPDAAPLPDIL